MAEAAFTASSVVWKLAGAALSKAAGGGWKLLSQPLVLRITKRKQMKALVAAVNRTITVFRKRYPELANAFFDEHFVLHRVGPEVEKLLRQSRSAPDPAAMADAFRGYFNVSLPPHLEQACTDFLRMLDEELEAEEALQEIMGGRAILSTAASATAIAISTARTADLLGRISSPPPEVPLPGPEALRALFAMPSADVVGAPRTLPGGGEFVRPELAQMLEC